MDKKAQLRERVAAMRQSLLDKGVLNENFERLEMIEETQPNFVENIIGTYFSQSTLYMDELKEALKTKPLDLANVERLIQKLKGGSASIGAGRLSGIVEEMWNVFMSTNTDRLYSAFLKVKYEHARLRRQLEPYAELLRRLRIDPDDGPSDEESVSNLDREEVESVDSNEMDSEE